MVSTGFLRGTIAAAFLALAGVTAAQAASVTLNVVSARTEPQWPDPAAPIGVVAGAAVPTYKFIVNIDNTGTTAQRSPAPGTGCSPQDAGYPNSCEWTSIAGAKGNSPVYVQGDESTAVAALTNVPPGRYLISVLADGYKLDGRHFTVNSNNTVTCQGLAPCTTGGAVTVEIQPAPFPDAQIQAAVFEDTVPVNGAPDLPAERGLSGFQGHIVDTLGEVTTDVYGAPLCESGRCLSACYVVANGEDVGLVQPSDSGGRCPINVPNNMSTCVVAGVNHAPYLLTVNPSPPRNTFKCPASLGGVPVSRPTPAGAVVEGKVKIPNVGTNRYSLSVTPPDQSGWVQTTTLEGNHDWDAWVMEGATGLDTEFILAGEPFPAIIFGYVPAPGTPSAANSRVRFPLTGPASNKITGVVAGIKIYVPASNGVAGLPGDLIGGQLTSKIDKPIEYPWLTLSDLDNGDTIVWAGQGGVDGTFTIPNVPAGNYSLTWWDEPQNRLLDLVNVTVGAGETVDMGILPSAGWWTFLDGYVYNDTNRNGVKDAGEPGLPGYGLTLRKRDNSLMDRGTTSTSTDPNGYYKFEAGYPMTQWLVLEAYDDLHYTTGVTYQADNQLDPDTGNPNPTTALGAGVDVSVLPIIGLSGTLDWGKHTYDSTGNNGIDPRNGGIVGTVSYDTTRNELDPRYAAVEDWQPSISNLVVKLYSPVAATLPCVRQPAAGATCDSSGRYALASDGSILKGNLLNTYLSETWVRPTGCVARGADGTALMHGVDEEVLPTPADAECIEAPMMGVQYAPYATPDPNFGASVDGNYGFGDGCFNGTLDPTDPSAPVCNGGTFDALPAGDYLVQVDLTSLPDATGNPIYKVTREEDINIGNGDVFIPPAVPPPACAGAMHLVDVAGIAPDGLNATVNQTFVDIGGSPYEGTNRPLCDTKLVSLANGKSIAPSFNLFTDVPLPGRHWFIIIDDLNLSSNPKSVTFGEQAGVPFVPVGIYDYTDRLIATVESDYNGLADVLLPSTNRINCPTPSGVCTNLYRYVGNDPGTPGALNLNYDPNFRTIAAEFEVMPGVMIPSDLAPTQVGISIQLPGGQTTTPVMCKLDNTTPQIYAVSRPYARSASVLPADRTIVINGAGFGSAAGQVALNGAALPGSAVTAWSDAQLTVVVPLGTVVGPKQLTITRNALSNGQSTINGLTVHVLGTGYNPSIYEAGPTAGKVDPAAVNHYQSVNSLPATANHAIQNALNAAPPGALVVVYPNLPTANQRINPRGAYYENLIISKPVKLQGVGPGSPDGTVPGSIIDGGGFGGDSPVSTDWYTTINALNWDGNQTVYDGAVISIYTASGAFPTVYTANTAPSIDGFDLRGGDQRGFPGNINQAGGGSTGQPVDLITQGGAIYANGYARNLQITNNIVQNNGGAYGTIRIGTPDVTAPDTNNHNENLVIAYNRVIANAGTSQAGAIGLFAGADNYQVTRNDICGNFSAEYGGGISHVGRSNNGTINNNRIYLNKSFDEGGGIMIAGTLPANPAAVSPGSGSVDIYNNIIQANLANDDGGGLRFLMAASDCNPSVAGMQACPINVYNNFIVNNISTHEGGGVALNDAPNVRFYNNTVMKNLTTATAATSSGNAAPAGLSTTANSDALQAVLPGGSPNFSNPLLFNNIFWDNRAGTRLGAQVVGIGATYGGVVDPTPLDYWDMGAVDSSGPLAPTNSILQANGHAGVTASATNVASDPLVIQSYDVGVIFNAWRNNPAFIGAIMVTADLPPNLLSNYHLQGAGTSSSSPAFNLGTASAAPSFDIDNQARPALGGFDAGADEFPGMTADLSITKTDGVASVAAGSAVTYTIVVANAGPNPVTNAPVTDTFPSTLTVNSWSCTATAGSSCAATGSGSNRTGTVTLLNGGSATFTATATLAASASGTLTNTASVAAASGVPDPNLGNNSATDTDTISVSLPIPALSVLDNFNRTNANTLANGTNWSQPVISGSAAIRVDTSQAFCSPTPCTLGGQATWNTPAVGFGAKQGAAFTFSNATGGSLILKASGAFANAPQNLIRVRPSGATVIVETTANFGAVYTNRGSLAAGASFALNDTLTAVANADGSVDVWKNTTYLGRSAAVAAFVGTGRIGMQMAAGGGGRIDNFSGGTVP